MTRETPNRCALARSFSFAPGNRPALFDKAIRSGADAVILDREDSVPVADKAMAREAVEREWERLLNLGVPLVVRINPSDTDAGMQDMSWLKRLPSPPAAVMLPRWNRPVRWPRYTTP